MPEAFLGPGSATVGWLLTYLLHSSALIVTASLITTVVRLRPATRDAIWKTALLGGIVTATAAVLSGVPTADLLTLHERIGSMQPGSGGGDSDAVRRWISDGPVSVRREIRVRVVEPDAACRKAVRASSPVEPGWMTGVDDTCASTAGLSRQLGVLGVLSVWLLGAVLGIARWVARWLALRPVVRTLDVADPRSRRLLRTLVGDGASWWFPSPRLRASEDLVAPCVLPGDIIALPRRCELELSDAELRAVLAHEWAHVSRRDVLWSSLVRIVAATLWVQPLNRWALRRLADATEQSCDDWALRRTGERLGLARSISLVAEWSMAWAPPGPGMSMGGGTRSGAAERVARILTAERPRPEPVWLRAGLIALLLAPMYWLPSVPPPSSVRQALFVEERAVVALGPRDGTSNAEAADSLTGADVEISRFVGPAPRD